MDLQLTKFRICDGVYKNTNKWEQFNEMQLLDNLTEISEYRYK